MFVCCLTSAQQRREENEYAAQHLHFTAHERSRTAQQLAFVRKLFPFQVPNAPGLCIVPLETGRDRRTRARHAHQRSAMRRLLGISFLHPSSQLSVFRCSRRAALGPSAVLASSSLR